MWWLVETPDSGQVSSGSKDWAKKSCLMEEATRGFAVKRRQRRRGGPVTGHLHENRSMVGHKAPQSICTRVTFVASSLSIIPQGMDPGIGSPGILLATTQNLL